MFDPEKEQKHFKKAFGNSGLPIWRPDRSTSDDKRWHPNRSTAVDESQMRIKRLKDKGM